jgi:hypothetical protein
MTWTGHHQLAAEPCIVCFLALQFITCTKAQSALVSICSSGKSSASACSTGRTHALDQCSQTYAVTNAPKAVSQQRLHTQAFALQVVSVLSATFATSMFAESVSCLTVLA